ncbi:MAG: alginate export family protein [Bacteroidota bacterium]|nr:alginate export family protein [Bacteroidota bacterium]MDP4213400.1 alginate export family protein [Bacteroidota bacterium]MDP4251234.1 alginate export family protein [Bacteroidota bacterium]
MKHKHSIRYFIFSAALLIGFSANAQLSFYGQLRTRTEYRDGQGAPLPKGSAPAFFTSQRSRLSLNLTGYRLRFGLTVQDTRVWGQDVSTINRTTTQENNGFMLYEAWAAISITDTTYKKGLLSFKVGRQEIIFDDQRLIGNLDWLQQGRHHDAGIFKYVTSDWNLQVGVAYNQNKENSSGTNYSETPPGNYTANTNGGAMYKSFEFGYANRRLKHGNVSFLIFADQFNKYNLDSTNTKIWDNGAWTRLTTGFYLNNRFNKWVLTASAYYQTGNNPAGQKLSAGLLSANLLHDFSSGFSAGPGVDFTSGGNSGSTVHAFDPLYGTPHKFWGLMDYFYASGGFGNRGLVDYYIKSRYVFSKRFAATADLHQFFSASAITNAAGGYVNRNFGTEADLVLNYDITPVIGFETGYGHFFSTSTLALPQVKNVVNANSNSNWAYLMIIIKPAFTGK